MTHSILHVAALVACVPLLMAPSGAGCTVCHAYAGATAVQHFAVYPVEYEATFVVHAGDAELTITGAVVSNMVCSQEGATRHCVFTATAAGTVTAAVIPRTSTTYSLLVAPAAD